MEGNRNGSERLALWSEALKHPTPLVWHYDDWHMRVVLLFELDVGTGGVRETEGLPSPPHLPIQKLLKVCREREQLCLSFGSVLAEPAQRPQC